MSETALKQVQHLVTQLSHAERAHLVDWLEATLDAPRAVAPAPAARSLYGVCADLGPGATDADIDEARRAMWATFPREDIA